ncbi:MAG: hypothetical protein LBJ81_02570 [Puniceicoccales bacterium]|jgi:hypothetical protein|nr:hypothetical protein [Puniceicoccales bacterium]
MDSKKILELVIGGMLMGSSGYASHTFEQPIPLDVLSERGVSHAKNMRFSAPDAAASHQFMDKSNQDEDAREAVPEESDSELELITRNQRIAKILRMKMSNGENLVNETTPDALRTTLERIEELYDDPNTSPEDKEALKAYIHSVASLVPGESNNMYTGVVPQKDEDGCEENVGDSEVIIFANILYGKMIGETASREDVLREWGWEGEEEDDDEA